MPGHIYCSSMSYIILFAAPPLPKYLEVSEDLLSSNPTRPNPCLRGKSRRKQPWGTPVKVKLLLPPRQSRGNSQFSLVSSGEKRSCDAFLGTRACPRSVRFSRSECSGRRLLE